MHELALFAAKQGRELSLFSGAGGGILGGMLLGWRTVAAVEIEEYPRAILLQRQADGILPRFPIWDDIRTFDGREWRGRVDIVTAGFPCQPFSVQGKRKQADDERNMWPETIRVISEVRPQFVLLENVQGIRQYLPVITRDLRRASFVVEKPVTVSAADTGALHIRKRVWILAHTNGKRRAGSWVKQPQTRQGIQTWAEFKRLVSEILQSGVPARSGSGVHDGIPHRVDRLRALGNAQLPQVAARAFEKLTKGDHQ